MWPVYGYETLIPVVTAALWTILPMCVALYVFVHSDLLDDFCEGEGMVLDVLHVLDVFVNRGIGFNSIQIKNKYRGKYV